MPRYLAFVCLFIGLFLSINGTLLAATRTPDAPPLEWLYYIAFVGNDSFHLYRTQPDTQKTQHLLRHLPNPTTPMKHVNIPPNSDSLFITSYVGDSQDVYRISKSGHRWENLSQTPDTHEWVVGQAGEWLFFSQRDDDKSDLYRLNIHTNTPQKISQNAEARKYISGWTSDGAWLFWDEYAATGTHLGFIGHHAASANPQVLAADMTKPHFLQVSANDQALYLQAGDSFYRFELSTGHIQTIANSISSPSTFIGDSPDGQWVYYSQRSSPTQMTLFAFSVADQSAHAILQAESMYSAFSPDGQWLAVSTHTGQNSHLYLMRPDGSPPQLLAPDRSFVGWADNNRSIIASADTFYRLDLTGEQDAMPTLHSNALRFWWTSGDWIIYQTLYGDINRLNLYTQQTQALYFSQSTIDFLGAENIPTHPTPAKPLAAGLFIAMCSLIFAYKFRVGGL